MPQDGRTECLVVERGGMEFRRDETNARQWERRFEIPMLVAAAFVIPSMLLEQPGVDQPWYGVGVALNWLVWTAFAVELVVSLAVAPNRWRYLLRHPIDAVIVVLTPPFLTSAVNGVRLLRLTRVARLLRLAPLVRWVFRSGGLRYAAIFAGLVLLASAEAFSVIENTSYFEGLYWAMTTITTVGYGDVLPKTAEAKAMAMVVMLVGIGFFAALAGALANSFIEGRTEEIVEAERAALTADEALLAKVDELAAQLEELRVSMRARL
jgi:voltage-gated potassium channel